MPGARINAQAGELIQLMRGIYVDQDVYANAAILDHAVRVAHYLYPNACLTSASAALLTPTSDGRLYYQPPPQSTDLVAQPGDPSEQGAAASLDGSGCS